MARKAEVKASLISPIDLVVVLEQAGVLARFQSLVSELFRRLPPGSRPTVEQLNNLFAEAMAGYPGIIREAIDKIKEDLFRLVLTGKSGITRDDSALS